MVNSTIASPDQRKLKGEKTRNGILQAAIKLFSERGFDGTSVKDITNAAGVPKSLFYHYFKSMDELLANITNMNNLRISEEEKSALSAMANNTDMMNAFIGRIYNVMYNDKEGLKILFVEALKNKNIFQKFLDRLSQFSDDFNFIMPEELKKGYDTNELAVLRFFSRFLPMIMLILTEEEVAEYYKMKPEQIRNLLFHVLQRAPLPAKSIE